MPRLPAAPRRRRSECRQDDRTTVPPTRKLAAILSSDVHGYARLMGDDERATFEAVVALRALMKTEIERHAGRVVDATGDALLAEFGSAVEALQSAWEIQRRVGASQLGIAEHRRMQLRIGLNLGDVIESDGALYGDGVNIAARIQGVAEPGGVCISGALREQVLGKLPLRFEAVAERHYKNIAREVAVFHVREALGVDAPLSDRSLAAPPATPPAPALPRPLSSFVGREADLAAVGRMLEQHRLVTLIGPGGIGKSRLALQVATQAAPRYADGVWWVELAALSDARLVAQAVASALGIQAEPGQSATQAVLAAMQDRQLLIVLDNCEHLLQACAESVRLWLEGAPRVHVLASSREALRLAGEASFPVSALELADETLGPPAEPLRVPEAMQLFVDRATAAQPRFVLAPPNWSAVAAICRRLDGIPLAIELAAARVRALPVEHIAARLSDRFRLLTRGDRAALPRQQTLRALIDWSHDLLTDGERILLRRLSVFAGSWTLDAAEAVCADRSIDAADLPDLLGALVDRSMVESPGANGRYRLLQTVRQYAQDRLDESGETSTLRDHHLRFFLGLAETASAGLLGSDQRSWLARLDPEGENFLAAHAWCDHATGGAQAGLRLMFLLKLYLFNRGMLAPLLGGVLDAIARPGADVRDIHRCRALQTAGQVGFMLGRFAQAQDHLAQALSIAEAVGDTGRAASVLQTLGLTCVALDDRAAAQRYLGRALKLARERGDQRELAAALNALAQLHRVEGTLDTAQALYEQALQITRHLGDHENTAVALINLALVAIGRGDHALAARTLVDALDIAESIGSQLTGSNVLAVAAGVAALRADWPQAAWLLAAARTQMRRTGLRLDPADAALLAPLAAQAQRHATEADSASIETAAPAVSYAQAMAATRAWLVRN